MTHDPSDPYADIIHLPHHRSKRHEPMPRAERAAQFSAFAALSGHGEAIRETARLTDCAPELTESARAALDDTLQQLLLRPESMVQITWFEPDTRKAGGAYRTTTTRLRRVEPQRRCLILADGNRIPLDAITELQLSES